MKTPTWAIVIGVCLMLLGGCSVSKNIQSINMPAMLEMQQSMMEEMANLSIPETSDSLSKVYSLDSTNAGSIQKMAKGMQKMFTISDYTKTWTVRLGYIGLIVAIIYIISGIFLLIKKSFSIQLVYAALAISLVFSITQSLILSSDANSGLMGKFAGIGNTFGIIIDIILLVVLLTIDKSDYFETPATQKVSKSNEMN